IGDKNPRIAFVYPDQRYGKGALKAARERARQYGIKLTAEVVLNHGVVDASSQVMALKKAKADYVFICGHISQMPALYKSMKTYSYDPYVFGVHLICNESIVPRLGEQTKKFIGIHFLSGWNSDAPGIKLAKNLVKKYNTDLTGKPTGFYTYGMGVIMVMVEGLKRAGRDLTLDKLRASLETFRGWDAYGVLAPLTFTSTNHMGPTKLSVFKTDPAKKQLVQVGWRTPLKLGEK
ncbi:MAG: ABC transporter substrate-binding protein, partial [Thermodesulfobacteriota bacterium]|nr:ABC transporter substrate-binding protein [Thermodesulfobacteriota bacterium]